MAMPEWTSCFGGMGWGMGFGGMFMILFWAVIIVGAAVFFRWIVDQSKGGKTPLQILQERYARGEIDKAEFDERKRNLA
jgi:putative membrane protein